MSTNESTNSGRTGDGDGANAEGSGSLPGGAIGKGRPWTTAELLELSSLDALGLLDEQERRQYEEGFAASTPAVKAMLRAHQSMELRAHEARLPLVAPPASLRERVIGAVLSVARQGPGAVLARIGPSGGEVGDASVVGSADEMAELDRLSRLAEGGRGRSRRVHALWRAAAIGCMAAAVLFGVVSVQLWGQFRRLDTAIRSNTVAEVFAKEFGPRFEASLMSPQTRFVQFEAGEKRLGPGGPQAVAVLLLENGGKAGQLFARDLPQNTPMTLSVVSSDGSARRPVLTFVTTDARAVHQLANLQIPDGSRLELHASAEQTPLLRSINL